MWDVDDADNDVILFTSNATCLLLNFSHGRLINSNVWYSMPKLEFHIKICRGWDWSKLFKMTEICLLFPGCPSGTFTNATGCQICPAGEYQPASGQFNCSVCPEGEGSTWKVPNPTRTTCSGEYVDRYFTLFPQEWVYVTKKYVFRTMINVYSNRNHGFRTVSF
jgi:hypothetical protein